MGLLIWFLVRFVKQREEFEKKADTFKDDIKKEIDGALKKIGDSADKFTKQLETAQNLSVDMRKAAYEFQTKIMQDTQKISTEVLQLSNKVGGADAQLSEIAKKVHGLYLEVESVSTKVSAHHKSLSMGAQAFANQKEELSKMKSEIVKLSDDLMIIKEVKTKKH